MAVGTSLVSFQNGRSLRGWTGLYSALMATARDIMAAVITIPVSSVRWSVACRLPPPCGQRDSQWSQETRTVRQDQAGFASLATAPRIASRAISSFGSERVCCSASARNSPKNSPSPATGRRAWCLSARSGRLWRDCCGPLPAGSFRSIRGIPDWRQRRIPSFSSTRLS